MRVVPLATGAEARLRNEGGARAVVLVNGGTARAAPGTWSATTELLAGEIAQRFPELAVVEVRYRVKTWHELPSCIADGRSAVELAVAEGASRVLLAGFSMGGAVAIGIADHPAAVERARRVAARAEAELGAALPESEINFLAMHLAVLAQRVNG